MTANGGLQMRAFTLMILLLGGCAHGVRCDDHLLPINPPDSRASANSAGSGQ